MAIEKTLFICEVSGKTFKSREEAEANEKVAPRVKIWADSVTERCTQSSEACITRLQPFLEQLKEQNGCEKIPFQLQAHPAGVVVMTVPMSNDTNPKEGIIWETIYDLLIGFSTIQQGPSFIVPVTIADNIIIELVEYYGKSGKYGEQEDEQAV